MNDLAEIIRSSERMVFFGGAGVSTESGIPDFRSVDGLYHQKFDYPPETMLSSDFFYSNTEDFYRFYRDKILISGVEPNAAHKALAKLEKAGKLLAVVTQNIDGLHQAAGSERVYELHGSAHRYHCIRCNKKYGTERLAESSGVPKCTCGGTIKPDVVLYGEMLDDATVNGAVRAIASADTMIVAGTSLVVYPAAGLVSYFNGKNLVLINRDETPLDGKCSLVIHGNVGEVLGKAVDEALSEN